MVEVYASVLDTENVENTVQKLESSGANGIHLDVLDGKYNSHENFSILNPVVVDHLKTLVKVPLEVHLMTNNPIDHVVEFSTSCETIIVHYESCDENELKNVLEKIRSCGRKTGVAIEPSTYVSEIFSLLSEIDLILVMTVRSGTSGQKYIDRSSEIKELDDYRKKSGLEYIIEVDGGMNNESSRLVKDAGADRLVSASFILNSNDYSKSIVSLKGILP